MVRLPDTRVILDTNTFLQGLLNPHGAAGQLLQRCEKHNVTTLLSRQVLSEYRQVLTSPAILGRFPAFTTVKVALELERFRYLAEIIEVTIRFPFSRDPRDAMFLELAIVGSATDLITTDQDLLSLRSGYDETAKRLRKRLPGLRIITPATFLEHHFPR